MKLFRFGAPGEERPGVLMPDGARAHIVMGATIDKPKGFVTIINDD